MTCDELDGLVTRFIDGELREAERTAILAHLRVCQGCRTRVDAESTAKHVLQAHATVARTMGVPPPWLHEPQERLPVANSNAARPFRCEPE